MRPGFCRVSLPFFMSDAELAFVLEALKMVATEGWKILPQYVVNPQTGQWRHHTCSVLRDNKSLYSLRFNSGKITVNERRVSGMYSRYYPMMYYRKYPYYNEINHSIDTTPMIVSQLYTFIFVKNAKWIYYL